MIYANTKFQLSVISGKFELNRWISISAKYINEETQGSLPWVLEVTRTKDDNRILVNFPLFTQVKEFVYKGNSLCQSVL